VPNRSHSVLTYFVWLRWIMYVACDLSEILLKGRQSYPSSIKGSFCKAANIIQQWFKRLGPFRGIYIKGRVNYLTM
jgi:hypothetical protein